MLTVTCDQETGISKFRCLCQEHNLFTMIQKWSLKPFRALRLEAKVYCVKTVFLFIRFSVPVVEQSRSESYQSWCPTGRQVLPHIVCHEQVPGVYKTLFNCSFIPLNYFKLTLLHHVFELSFLLTCSFYRDVHFWLIQFMILNMRCVNAGLLSFWEALNSLI